MHTYTLAFSDGFTYSQTSSSTSTVGSYSLTESRASSSGVRLGGVGVTLAAEGGDLGLAFCLPVGMWGPLAPSSSSRGRPASGVGVNVRGGAKRRCTRIEIKHRERRRRSWRLDSRVHPSNLSSRTSSSSSPSSPNQSLDEAWLERGGGGTVHG